MKAIKIEDLIETVNVAPQKPIQLKGCISSGHTDLYTTPSAAKLTDFSSIILLQKDYTHDADLILGVNYLGSGKNIVYTGHWNDGVIN